MYYPSAGCKPVDLCEARERYANSRARGENLDCLFYNAEVNIICMLDGCFVIT